MNRDEIMEMARQAGLFTHREVQPEIVAFAKLVAEKALAQRLWVGLTDEEKNDCLVSADPCETLAEPEARQLIEDVEQALKEKNT